MLPDPRSPVPDPRPPVPDPRPAELRRAFAYIVPYWRRLALVLGLSLFGTALSLYLPYLSKGLVDEALLGRDMRALVRIVAWFGGITLVSFGLNVVSGLRYTRVSAEILFDMRLALYRHLQRLSPRFYARTKVGDIVSRINTDIGEIQRVAAEAALAWVGNVLFLVGTVAMIVWLDVRLFLVSVLFVPPGLWALVHYRRRLEGRVTVLRERSADIGSFLIETLQGMRLTVTSNAQGRETDRFRAKNDSFIAALMSMQWLTYLAGGLPGLILSGSTAVVFLYGGQRVIAGAITLGTFVAFMAYQTRLLQPIQALMGLYASLATARVSLRRVHQILDVAPDVREGADPVSLDGMRGDVEFESVSLTLDRGIKVLDDVSFTVRGGETLAIVGPSGAGKSTIVDLLLRLMDPDDGRVRIDGHDLRAVRLDDIRRYVVPVDQEPFVFNTSIRENLRYARPNATDEQLGDAVRAAGLADFVDGLPEGLETQVGERGLALSSGERQRIAVARAFLADPAVLILDEPTASLDPIAERQVVRGYEALMRDRTTIVISHRLGLALQADRVIVLDDAKLVEEGSAADLQAAGGAFARLFGRSETVAP